MATLKDTTILNDLFQKEFHTSIQLSDVLEFINNRVMWTTENVDKDGLHEWATDEGYCMLEDQDSYSLIQALEGRYDLSDAVADSSLTVSDLFSRQEIISAYEEIYPKNEAQQQFIEDQACHCPACGSEDIEMENPIGVENHWTYAQVSCTNCGARWDNRYDLAGYSDLTLQEKDNG
jgi:hypothetical protein